MYKTETDQGGNRYEKDFALVLALCLTLTSLCAFAENEKYTIVVMPKQVGITYFEARARRR